MTEPPDLSEEVEEFGRIVEGLLCTGRRRTEPSFEAADVKDGVRGWKYAPPLDVLTIDSVVRAVCGEPGLGLSSYEDLKRLSILGVMYGRTLREDACEETVGARLRVSVSEASRASSITAGSSSVIPLRISAKTAIIFLNSASVRHRVEKRANS